MNPFFSENRKILIEIKSFKIFNFLFYNISISHNSFYIYFVYLTPLIAIINKYEKACVNSIVSIQQGGTKLDQ